MISRLGKNGLQAICLCIIVVFFAVGLWPFNPFPHNQVNWLGTQNGLHFGDRGIVFSSAKFGWPASQDISPCALEIWLQPGPRPNDQGVFLTFYQPDAPERFKMYQWEHSILLVYSDDDQARHQEIDVEAFRPDTPVLITITTSPQGTSVYLNGKLAETSKWLVLSRSLLSGQLVLGTSPMYDNRWSGQLRGLAFYGKELTADEISLHVNEWTNGMPSATAAKEGAAALYTLSEHTGDVIHDQLGISPNLYIPKSYRILHKTLLMMPWREFRGDWGEASDVAVNVLGFIPFGFFICAWLSGSPLRGRAALATIIAGAAISLSIEMLQFYLPTRVSSASDALTNILGTCAGVLLYRSKVATLILGHRTLLRR